MCCRSRCYSLIPPPLPPAPHLSVSPQLPVYSAAEPAEAGEATSELHLVYRPPSEHRRSETLKWCGLFAGRRRPRHAAHFNVRACLVHDQVWSNIPLANFGCTK